MGKALVPRYLAPLDFSALTDDELHTQVSNIKTASATSALVLANPPMATSVDALVVKDAKLVVSNKAVSDAKVKFSTAIGSEAQARADVLGELRTYATFASNFAKSPADLSGAAVGERAKRTVYKTAPDAPDRVDVRPPKTGHGKNVAAVHETGSIRYQYVAEQSADGLTWAPLGLGRGKTRTVTGASGAKVWVRFARVRGQLQSEWSTPVLITIP